MRIIDIVKWFDRTFEPFDHAALSAPLEGQAVRLNIFEFVQFYPSRYGAGLLARVSVPVYEVLKELLAIKNIREQIDYWRNQVPSELRHRVEEDIDQAVEELKDDLKDTREYQIFSHFPEKTQYESRRIYRNVYHKYYKQSEVTYI